MSDLPAGGIGRLGSRSWPLGWAANPVPVLHGDVTVRLLLSEWRSFITSFTPVWLCSFRRAIATYAQSQHRHASSSASVRNSLYCSILSLPTVGVLVRLQIMEEVSKLKLNFQFCVWQRTPAFLMLCFQVICVDFTNLTVASQVNVPALVVDQ